VSAEALRVEVVYCPRPHVVDSVSLSLDRGATVRQAIEASGLAQRHGLELAALRAGVWGRVQELDAALRDRDRVEIYRPLIVDPKEARRLRYRRARERNG
jgi:uncharacterized protein